MNKRGAGVTFTAIAAFLYAVRSIVESTSLGYMVMPLLTWSIISLIIGICYLLVAELPKSTKEKINKFFKEFW